jgi:hypothetical protein
LTAGVASACPQCGAPLRFGGAASLAAVCAYCRSAVLRAGARLELAGKVPDLVATDTRLAVGATGKLQGRGFVILGRLQLSQGAATWNEWYASLGGADWGWLAEAQGRLFATRPIAGAGGLPAFESLAPGAEVDLPGGLASVDEVNEARLVSFEGELPVRPEPGESWRYADLSTGGGGFATIDYGSGGEPVLYAGRELSYAEAGLADRAPPFTAGAEPARALTCPGCGGRVELRRPDVKAFACPSCRSLLDVSGGDLRVVSVLEGRARPPIPLGAKGTLRGEALEVLGFLARSTEVDGERFAWQELLLHGAGGYRWLSAYEGHWLLLRPIAAGKVQLVGRRSLRCEGRTFKHFQGAPARCDDIQGELYWEVRAGEEVRADDYVAPPFLLSAERSESEVSYSLGESVPGAEVWKAFALPGRPPREVGVGAAQPNPYHARIGPRWRTAGIALLALALLAGAAAAFEPREEVLALDVPLQAGRVTLSEPFQLAGGPQAIEIDASADVEQAWIGLDVALIEDDSGESEAVAFELSSYSGVSDGEAWSEGSRQGRAVVGSVRDGRYLLRIEPEVERGRGSLPASVHVRVVRGVFLWTPLALAMAIVVAWPVLLSYRAVAFERRRWQGSDHPWGGKG